MADNGRWFKVWTAILGDPDFQGLSFDDRGRWVTLGALTKLSGERGVLQASGPGIAAVARTLGCEPGELVEVLGRLPNLSVTLVEKAAHDGTNRVNGSDGVTLTIAWRNWRKYQEDTTAASRMRTLRAKKRREEKRETTPVVTREEVSRDGAPDPSGGPEGLSASDWIGPENGRPAGPTTRSARELLRDPEHMRRFSEAARRRAAR
jgi:hypothetical protein